MKISLRLKAKSVCIGIAVLLVVCALVALVFAAYLFLEMRMEPLWAALAVAGGCLVLALVALLLARTVLRRKQGYNRDDLEHALRENADYLIRDLIVRHPDRAAIVALAIGIAAGSSRTVRQGLLAFLNNDNGKSRQR